MTSVDSTMNAKLLVIAQFLVLVGGCSSTTIAKGERMLRIHYFPIGAETLTPVTTENIEKRGERCEISSPEDVARIKHILGSAVAASRPEEAFTDKAVRVKMLEGTGGGQALIAVVENEGTVRQAGTDNVLSPAALKELKRLIERRCK